MTTGFSENPWRGLVRLSPRTPAPLSGHQQLLDDPRILHADELDRKSPGELPNHAPDDLADREHRSELRGHVRRHRGAASRQVENETALDRAVGQDERRERILRHAARLRALLAHLEILVFLEPRDLVRELAALLRACRDAHEETAPVEQALNGAFELAEMLDLRAHPLAGRTGHRRHQCHGAGGYVDGAAGELPGLDPRGSAVPERIPSRQADDDAKLASSLHRR